VGIQRKYHNTKTYTKIVSIFTSQFYTTQANNTDQYWPTILTNNTDQVTTISCSKQNAPILVDNCVHNRLNPKGLQHRYIVDTLAHPNLSRYTLASISIEMSGAALFYHQRHQRHHYSLLDSTCIKSRRVEVMIFNLWCLCQLCCLLFIYCQGLFLLKWNIRNIIKISTLQP
jgi:hypothetical protein